MKNKNLWHIGCSVNDAYSQHFGVMIFSLLENCSCPERIKIFMIDGGISNKNKVKINKVIKQFHAKIEYLVPNTELVKDLKICRHLGIETYNRFSLMEKIDLEKILYLDCDLIVEGDIKEIFDKDVKNKLFFAVKDGGVPEDKKEGLGIPKGKPYFNAGVLLINCKKWKKEKITSKTIEYVKKNPSKIEFADQDGLNGKLHDQWEELGPSWNVLTRMLYQRYVPFKLVKDYTKIETKKILKNIKILHYAGFPKPWFFWDIIPGKKRYLHYLEKTPWKNYKFPDKNIKGFLERFFTFIKIVSMKKKDI